MVLQLVQQILGIQDACGVASHDRGSSPQSKLQELAMYCGVCFEEVRGAAFR